MMRSPAPEPREPERAEYREERPKLRAVPRTREVLEEGDVVRWGPVLGGLVASMSIMLVLTVLGVAVGLATIATGGGVAAVNATNWAIWTSISMIISLFFGGWLAARTSVFGGIFPGIVNASVVWASVLVVTLFLVGLGVSVAAGPLGGMFPTAVTPGTTPPPGTAATAALSAVWAFVGLVVSYVAAIAGGYWGGLWHAMRHVEPPARPTR